MTRRSDPILGAIRHADPLDAVRLDELLADGRAEALRTAIPDSPRPPSTARRRIALRGRTVAAIAAGFATLAAGVLAADVLREPSPSVQGAIDSLSLPAPDRDALSSRPQDRAFAFRMAADGGTWEGWTVATRGKGILLVLIHHDSTGRPTGRGSIGGCPPLAADRSVSICGAGAGPHGVEMHGRVGDGVAAVEAIAPQGHVVSASVQGGFYVVDDPDGAGPDISQIDALPTIVARDALGQVIDRADLRDSADR